MFAVPLGSIPELPAKSCKEIKANEGQATNGKYWFYSIIPGRAVLAYCDMNTEGTLWIGHSSFIFFCKIVNLVLRRRSTCVTEISVRVSGCARRRSTRNVEVRARSQCSKRNECANRVTMRVSDWESGAIARVE